MFNYVAREKQIMPNCKHWLLLAGRGFGKTRAGAENIAKIIREKRAKRIAIIGCNLHEVRQIMVEGVSGLLNSMPEAQYFSSLRKIETPYGVLCQLFSGNDYNSLRGFQFDCVWIDEFCKFSNPAELWQQVKMCTRMGNAKIIITSTPKNLDILKEIINHRDTLVTTGSSFENKAFLSESFLQYAEEIKDTQVGKQEILGHIISDKSLWTSEDIKYDKNDTIISYKIGIDPAVSGGTTGIVLVGHASNGLTYVIEDFSTNSVPCLWTKQVAKICEQYKVSCINVESNQGGDMLITILRMAGVNCKINLCHAQYSKEARSLPIYLMYKEGKIFHRKNMHMLEEEMLKEPKDRVDALVWALHKCYSNPWSFNLMGF